MDVSAEMLAWKRRRRGECEWCGRLLEFCDCNEREQWQSGGEDESRDIDSGWTV